MKNITPEEREKLIKEMAHRCKDVVFMRAKEIAKEWVDSVWVDSVCVLPAGLQQKDTISLDYHIEMLGTDIMQIIGRSRRLEEK